MPSRLLFSTSVKNRERQRAEANENGVFEFDYAEPPPVFDVSQIYKKTRVAAILFLQNDVCIFL